MTEVKPVDGIFPIDDDVLAALKALPGWPLHIWMAEMSARIESDRAEIAALKAEVERLKDAAAVVSNTLNDIRGGFHAGVDPSRWVDEVRAYLGTGRAR